MSDQKELPEKRHCGLCGTTHGPEGCPETAFCFFICSECHDTKRIPRDAMFGLDQMVCGCGKTAHPAWKQVDVSTYRYIDNLQTDLKIFMGFVKEVVPKDSPLYKKILYIEKHHLGGS